MSHAGFSELGISEHQMVGNPQSIVAQIFGGAPQGHSSPATSEAGISTAV